MKCKDLIAAFEIEIDKIDDYLNKPLTDDTIYWINQAVVKFVKDRFNGNAPKRTSYEQNEKRTRDLIRLLVDTYLDPDYVIQRETDGHGNVIEKHFTKIDVHPKYTSVEYTYPEDMMFVLNEDVIISDINGNHPMDTCVFECTADNFMYRVNNSLTDFHYRYNRARPLRVRTSGGFKLLTDGKYKIDQYKIGYLRIPEEITNEDPNKEYEDFADYTWLEIIKIAAQMYLENQSDNRYKTITQEVLTQE